MASDGRAPSIADAPLQTGVGRFFSRASERLERLFEAERDQLPLWLPVGLGLGIAAWFALPDSASWTAFLLASGALFFGFLTAGGTRWGRALAIFSLAVALGCGLIWWKAERAAAPRLERAQMAEFAAAVQSFQRVPAKQSVRLIVSPVEAPNLPTKLRINVDEEKARNIAPGSTIRLRAWLMPPAQMAVPGAYDFARVAWFQGIGGTGRALGENELISPPRTQGFVARIAAARQRLADHVGSRLGGGEGGIATALATGDQGAISEEDAEAMRRSGLAHLLSVSGLHLTAVVGAVMLLTLKLLALSPTLALRWPLVLIAAAAGATAGIAYTLLTGAEVPTVRACVAALLILLGLALGREAFTMRLLAVGALIVLLFWPESLAGPSFQLSFAAIAAIVALHEHPKVKALLSRRDEGFLQRSGRFLLGLILTGLAVEIALAPIALYHFHKAGFYGALANIVAIPLTTFIVMPLEALALLFDLAGLGAPFWWLTGKSLSLLLDLAHATANAPGAVALLPTMPRGAFAMMVLGGLWICLWKTRWRRWGLLPALAGATWAVSTPAPDLIVTGDGRHLAIRTSSGGFALLRGRAGDYVRDMLSETSGYEGELLSIEDLPAAACSADLCAADIVRDGRRWRLLATRSPRFVEWKDMVRACAGADIVVADRLLPRACSPRWLKADRTFLAKSGGFAVTLEEQPRVTTVAERVGSHPWAR
ncbi:MAG TPA: ComEC/Rec2 family competence protein [Allosphingosinicella sp.]|uniref:ComEC/Rec2 family competence protein n=1 Tax=Allosphingosinicella sp. TaxID=2823234 RepID=UPI002ED9AAE2